MNSILQIAGQWLRRVRPHVATTLCAAAVLTLPACGGSEPTRVAGGGSDGLGVVPDSAASGVITGFGSVIVNGVRWDVSTADIAVNGVSNRGQDDLRVGMVVTVTGKRDAAASSGRAVRIAFDNLLQGSVEATLAVNSLRVAGQTVQVSSDTQFEGVADAASLRLGDRVQVSGFRERAGVIRATWIGVLSTVNAIELTAPITAVGTGSIQAAGLIIDTRSAQLVDVPAGGLVVGQWVRIVLAGPPIAGNATATRVRVISSGFIPSVINAQLQGLVEDYSAAAGTFEINDQPVWLTAATRFVDGTRANLVENARVEVRGVVVSGALQADEVRFLPDLLGASARGPVATVDAPNSRLVMFTAGGLEVRVDSDTLLVDSLNPSGPLNLATLTAADDVLVLGRGSPSGSGGGRIDARVVQRLLRGGPAVVDGEITAASGTRLAVLGVAVEVSGAVTLNAAGQPITPTEFLAQATAGRSVRADGRFGGGVLTANVVRLQIR
ncbi:DUF5666 domain-containing protein [Piscinibacterium candidicorallinum]|uniref:DUF5666 domain-containing protein n=1 Tax=Piscinibacterium candidicorallinum TaxID=1793872 RepID=A0ABV7H585_9BURK